MRKMLQLAALLAALALVVAGCGGGGDSSESSSSASGGGPQAEAAETPDAGTLQTGGEAAIASAQGVGQLDPYKILFAFEGVVHPLMWSALTKYTQDGGAEVQPDLAESWTASKDLRTHTFKLRPGLKLSNGEPLTAEVVAASLKRAFDPETAFLWVIFIPKAEKIEAVDDTTVRITLAQPARDLPAALAKVPIQDVSTLKQIDRDPVVTGPYKVASFTPDQDLELVHNEHYYGEPPNLERVTFTKAQDNTAAVTALRGGDIQALWSVPWTDVRELSGSDEITVTTGDEPVQNVIVLTDNTSGVFENVKARQALAHAVNREAILQSIYAEHGIVPTTNNPIPAWSDLVNEDLPAYEYDLEKAKQLFEEAGVGPGTTLTFWAPAGQYTEWTSVGEVLQKDLQSIGIELKIETNEISQWAERFAPAGKTFPNLIVPNVYGGLPVPLNLASWVPGICECNFDDAEFNQALDEAQAAGDDAEYGAALDRAQEVFNAEVPVTIVVQTAIPVGHVADLQGIWIDPTGLARFGDAGYAG